MKTYILAISLILIFASCKQKNDSLPFIDIDIKKTGEFALSEIADSVKLIPLETREECLISTIRKVKFSSEYVYVSESQRLLQFNLSGKFIRQISKTGRGPGEFRAISDFCIDPNNENLYIISFNKILRFNAKGQLLQEFSIQGFPEQIIKLDSSIWINIAEFAVKQTDGKSHNISKLIKLDSTLNPIDSTIVNDVGLIQGFSFINPSASYFSSAGDRNYFYYPSVLIEPVVRDTLFHIENDKLIPAIKFNFGEEITKLTQNQKQVKDVPPYKKFRIMGICATMQYLFVNYSLEDKDYFASYNSDNEIIFNMENGFNDDFYQTGKVILKPLNYATNYMYFIKEGFEIADKIDIVDENDNPVLMLVKLKE